MNGLKADLKSRLRTDDLFQLTNVLRDFKTRGGTMEAAYEALVQLRAEPGLEHYEDRLLELMDIVKGFCSPHMRVWEADK